VRVRRSGCAAGQPAAVGESTGKGAGRVRARSRRQQCAVKMGGRLWALRAHGCCVGGTDALVERLAALLEARAPSDGAQLSKRRTTAPIEAVGAFQAGGALGRPFHFSVRCHVPACCCLSGNRL